MDHDPYLAHMGIQQWQLRSAQSENALQVVQQVAAAQWLFVLEKDEALVHAALAWDNAPMQLLQAILAAIGQTPASIHVVVYDGNAHSAQDIDVLTGVTHAVCLGDVPKALQNCLTKAAGQAQWINSVSLAQLAQDKQAKRQLWQQLKSCQ